MRLAILPLLLVLSAALLFGFAIVAVYRWVNPRDPLRSRGRAERVVHVGRHRPSK